MKLKITISIIIGIFVLGGIVLGARDLIRTNNYKNNVATIQIPNVDLSKIEDGEYHGSYDADAISGATNSSKVIMKAVENALIN